LPLKEDGKVKITIEPELALADRTAGMLKWDRDFEELRRLVADDEFGIIESRNGR
jgi:hypothetical protein